MVSILSPGLPDDNSFPMAFVEQEFLLTRLKRVDTGYDLTLCCMEGTREALLNQIMAWATNGSDTSNLYWIHGLPGIGKTSLAHSICKKLHNTHRLAGAFFCQRDDANMSELRNILPTLIFKLAEIFPPFRSIVADRLRSDPNLTSKSMDDSLFLDFICNLPRYPEHALVFVIDALYECGDNEDRPVLLKVLAAAAAHAPWLKIIVTSRPEDEIQDFFNRLPRSSYSPYDLATDQEAGADLQTFARSQFNSVAKAWCLPTPWPEQPLFDSAISQANGLFIFIRTLVLALKQCEEPEETLKVALQDSTVTGSKLYKLYSGILKAQRIPNNAEFRQMIGVILTAAAYRTLCEETIAELVQVRPNLVKKWVNNLSSLLYRDETADGGIRVRHLSISDFFVSDHCDYQVNLEDANMQLGISCLKTMVEQLRFNICKLEDSRLANADVHDLPSRIKEHVSDALQYSSLYWSNHLCSTPDKGDLCVWGQLKEFFGGLYGLFWVEMLSIMGMVPIGAPSLRRLISWAKVSVQLRISICQKNSNLMQNADSTVVERIQDFCRFIITFHTPISLSTPHTYISTGPFLPSQSPLSSTFSKWFTKTIKMQKGKLLLWPAPPLQWIGHSRTVSSLSCSPNGHHIVTGSYDKTLRIWDIETGATVGNPLLGHTGELKGVAYSPDGRYIVSASDDMTIRIWDAETGAQLGTPLEGHTGYVSSVAYSPNGQHIISGSEDETIRIWDAGTGVAIGTPLIGHTGPVLSLAYSPNGQHIISGSEDRTIRIWDAGTGAAVGNPLHGHTWHVRSVAYSPDGRHIVSGSVDKSIRIWDANTGDEVGWPLAEHTNSVWSVAYSPNGQHIISGSADKTIRIWDAETGAAIGTPLVGHAGDVPTVAYSTNGEYIISGSGDNTIRVWGAKTGVAFGNPVLGHTNGVESVAYTPDGRYIISGSFDKTIMIWNAETGAAVGKPLQGHTGVVRSIACSPNGRHIISGSDDRTIQIWDAEIGAAVIRPLRGHTGGVDSVAYSPNGQRIISGSGDRTIRIWDAETGSAIGKPLIGHTSGVWSIAYSPNGRRIISGSNDTTIRIWDAETGADIVRPLQGHTGPVCSVAYSSDGRHIISGSGDMTIRIWDAETGAAVGEPLKGHTDEVASVVYSPNGQYIISASADKTIRIWDSKTGGAMVKPLKAHAHEVRSVACSPHGQHIASGAWDYTIHVWDIFQHLPIPPWVSGNQTHADFCAQPDGNGWVRDSENGLLYWVPLDCRTGLHSPALLTIPPTSHTRSVALNFEDFVFGTSWTQMFNSTNP